MTDTENKLNDSYNTPSTPDKRKIIKLLHKPKNILSDLSNSPKSPLTPTKSTTPSKSTPKKLSKKQVVAQLLQTQQALRGVNDENVKLRSEIELLKAQLIQSTTQQEYAESDQKELKRKNENLTNKVTELQEKLNHVQNDENGEIMKRWRSFCSKQNSPPGTAMRKRPFSKVDIE